ncbi:NAD-glutamate dehydrogenase [Pleomorphomonas diazotrophica]|uniref:NAD-glutamate dehydrogenase n=1 Tax=Pleomorphomonas diazotrophica TaxID=1166257 RepID=A0A1I4RVL4_9HYPH|nr:NAD-glutamate dehydrogenase [Pleomorphomonas diazotrophica]PKR88024.1 NAD-glutamate dehydrogenase [Pleomorphomonas diazotrophica]SFM56199.1 glutamate dehydrogenase (NAD) [Pleomorphomonas diazotrophica]
MKRVMEVLKEARLDEAADLAAQSSRPEIAGLLKSLYGKGAAEDVVVYTASELVAFAEGAMSSLSLRVPGIHSIRIYNPVWDDEASHRKEVTVVDILNDNMPFLVDSVMQELTDAGIEVRLMVHPILSVVRGMSGRLLSIGDDPDANRESFIHIHIARLPDAIAASQLETRLDGLLTEVRAAVDDWPRMQALVKSVINVYRHSPPPLPPEAVAEAVEFLNWLNADNFTFLGLREYVVGEGKDDDLPALLSAGAGYGLLRDPAVRVLRRGRELVQVTPEITEFLRQAEPLIIAKANVKARVHRHAYLDYIGIKRYEADGRLISELRLLGLFTSSAYTRSTHSIPYLRRKVGTVMARAGFDPESHSGRALRNILESYPRDELFQVDLDTLLEFSLSILELGERPRIRVLARRDKFDRFVSLLVYVPRDRYNTDTRLAIGNYLADAFAGRVSSVYPAFPEGPLARVHYIIGRDEGPTPAVAQAELEAAVARITRNWGDGFADACRAKYGPARGRKLIELYGRAFPEAYRASYDAETAVADVALLELFVGDRWTAVELIGGSLPSPRVSMRLMSRGGPVPLSARVPVLEAMGFTVLEEKTFEIDRPGEIIVLHDMALRRADGVEVDLSRDGNRLKALFMAVWLGRADSDRLNALTLVAGLGWREIAMLRALSRYLGQIGLAHGHAYVAEALVRNAGVATLLVSLFTARFDPAFAGDRAARLAALRGELETAFRDVPILDDDRILRRLANLIEAATRTTFFQIGADGGPHPVMGFKFDAARIDGLPAPRPFAEIWLHAPDVEGVHLRFGKVARGGLRWSDRPEDFRTEILGLVKAQQVKNAVIVPVGAKGGFVARRITGGDRAAAGVAAYERYVGTLIDLTDNIVDDAIVPPGGTVRYDGDDPYLVVAADKGTASFSDVANRIALSRGFWLADAFASGGSAGYDHKKMGITARGAFEAVKRHFRELDLDVEADPLTAVGVGDMSGDVFGNFMLLSPSLKLVAAFDHRHIFIDPTPDAKTALTERRRLFALPRSSWADYDAAKLSSGGGIFPRTQKSIALSAEARAALGIDAAALSPDELVSALLKAPVDLLFFGGIGTFVRGNDESNVDAGDRANDGVRIPAGDLRARVVGEGANLGMTPRARVDFARHGGRVNSDAIDNVGGVATSDAEVNIKIALGRAVAAGRLTLAERDELLAGMTDDVAAGVLRLCRRQVVALSVTRARGFGELPRLMRLSTMLTERGLLDPRREGLPDEAAAGRLAAAGETLSRPETAILMAHAKLMLSDELLEGRLIDDPALGDWLTHAFPAAMRARFAEDIAGHRLARDILATRVAGAAVDAAGPTFVSRLGDEAGVTAEAAVRALVVAAAAFGTDAVTAEIDALEGKISGAVWVELRRRVADFLIDAALWVAQNGEPEGSLASAIERLAAGVRRFRDSAPAGVADPELVAAGVPEPLAARLASLPAELGSLDLIVIGEEVGRAVDEVLPVMTAIDEALAADLVARLADVVRPADLYEGQAAEIARRTFAAARRRIVAKAIAEGGADLWTTAREARIGRLRQLVGDLLAGPPTVAKLTVAAGLVAELAE